MSDEGISKHIRQTLTPIGELVDGLDLVEPVPDTSPQNERPEEPRDRLEPGDYELAHGGTRDEACAVDANCERGRPDDWFEVHYAAEAVTIHFCARHALPAEALITLGGWRARDVPDGLRLLERGGARALPKVERDGGVSEKGG